jgi:hypothetical protein
MPVEKVRPEDGEGKPMPESLLPMHNGDRMPSEEAGTPILFLNYTNKG